METDLMETIKGSIDKTYSKKEVTAMNALTLAYIGDSVFSNFVRQYLIGCGHQNVHYMTKCSTLYVKASAQAGIIHSLINALSEEEIRIVKRGRNTYSRVPKNAHHLDYRYATGFEALVGYLYLLDDKNRLEWLCFQGISFINEKESLH